MATNQQIQTQRNHWSKNLSDFLISFCKSFVKFLIILQVGIRYCWVMMTLSKLERLLLLRSPSDTLVWETHIPDNIFSICPTAGRHAVVYHRVYPLSYILMKRLRIFQELTQSYKQPVIMTLWENLPQYVALVLLVAVSLFIS